MDERRSPSTRHSAATSRRKRLGSRRWELVRRTFQTQGSCAYANTCEPCPNFSTDTGYLAVLGAQHADTLILAADAEAAPGAPRPTATAAPAETTPPIDQPSQRQHAMSNTPAARVRAASEQLLTTGQDVTFTRRRPSQRDQPHHLLPRPGNSGRSSTPTERHGDLLTLAGLADRVDQLTFSHERAA